MLNVVADETARTELGASLDEICREGARRMLAAALEVEVDAYVEALADELDEEGKRLVVRNGHTRPHAATHDHALAIPNSQIKAARLVGGVRAAQC